MLIFLPLSPSCLSWPFCAHWPVTFSDPSVYLVLTLKIQRQSTVKIQDMQSCGWAYSVESLFYSLSLNTHTHTHIHTYTHTHMQMHTHKHTHMHAHTHTHFLFLWHFLSCRMLAEETKCFRYTCTYVCCSQSMGQ